MQTINISYEDLQINELKISKEMRVIGKGICTDGVSSHLSIISNRLAIIIEFASTELKPQAIPFDHIADEFVYLFSTTEYHQKEILRLF